MIIRIRFLGAVLLLTCYAAFACTDGKSPMKIVFSDSEDYGVNKPDFSGDQVCLNLKQDDYMLSRKPIGAQDANKYWPIVINLGKQEVVQRIYWPDRTELLAQIAAKEGPYPDGAGTICALVGSVSLFKATLLKLGFDHLEPGTLQKLYVSTNGFEYLPSEHPSTTCVNVDKPVKPDATAQLQFKVSKGIQGGKLTILFINNQGKRGEVELDFDRLVKAADDWSKREANQRPMASATGISALANSSFNASEQIKIESGYISVSYVKPQ